MLLASRLGFAFVDTDYIIESLYARRLQDVTDALPREKFLDAEAAAIATLRGGDCVIATGGSVVYRPEALTHLHCLGFVIHLFVSFEIVNERIATNPERGISFGPGQTITDIYKERMPLYDEHADFVCDTTKLTPSACVDYIVAQLLQRQGNTL